MSQRTSSSTAAAPADGTTPFTTIVVLNVVVSFAAADATDALLRLGLVSKTFCETVNFFGAQMWRSLIDIRFPPSTSSPSEHQHHHSGGRASKWSYQRRLALRLTRSQDFLEIEECGLESNKYLSPNLAFACPMFSSDMEMTFEVSPLNGLPILHCQVCNKRVMPVTNNDEKQQAAAQGQCVVLHFPEHQRIAMSKAIRETKPHPTNAGPPLPPSPSINVSVCVVTTATPHSETDLGPDIMRRVVALLTTRVVHDHYVFGPASNTEFVGPAFVTRDLAIAYLLPLPGGGSADSAASSSSAPRPPPPPPPSRPGREPTQQATVRLVLVRLAKDTKPEAAREVLGPNNAPCAGGGWKYFAPVDAAAANICAQINEHSIAARSRLMREHVPSGEDNSWTRAEKHHYALELARILRADCIPRDLPPPPPGMPPPPPRPPVKRPAAMPNPPHPNNSSSTSTKPH